jgi:hypothetical protein
VNWNASEFWVDGGSRGNQAYGIREAYGSISDDETVDLAWFPNQAVSPCVTKEQLMYP